jgi:hypothetical protein
VEAARTSRAWERYAWAAGILYVIALLAEIVVALGVGLTQNDSAAKIASGLHEHRDRLLAVTPSRPPQTGRRRAARPRHQRAHDQPHTHQASQPPSPITRIKRLHASPSHQPTAEQPSHTRAGECAPPLPRRSGPSVTSGWATTRSSGPRSVRRRKSGLSSGVAQHGFCLGRLSILHACRLASRVLSYSDAHHSLVAEGVVATGGDRNTSKESSATGTAGTRMWGGGRRPRR